MKNKSKKKESHSPKKMKNIPWLVCRYCGLLYLKNDITRKAIKEGCREW